MADRVSADVECTECKELLGALDGLSRSELSGLVTSLLVACHAAMPHNDHPLAVRLPEVRGVDRELSIRCLHWLCKNDAPLVARVPVELVAALTLVFHTSHEGHPIEITFDGRTWSSPLSHQSPESRRHGPTTANPA